LAACLAHFRELATENPEAMEPQGYRVLVELVEVTESLVV
jgi:hypothetical protein